MNYICHGCKNEIKEGDNKYHDTYSNIYYCVECTSKGKPIKRQLAIGLEKSIHTSQAVGEVWGGCAISLLLIFGIPFAFIFPLLMLVSMFENGYATLIVSFLYVSTIFVGGGYLLDKIKEWKE